MNSLDPVIEYLKELQQESDISKNFRIKIDQLLLLLHSDSDLVVDKAILALEEINSQEMSSYQRTKVWDLVTLLEGAKGQ